MRGSAEKSQRTVESPLLSVPKNSVRFLSADALRCTEPNVVFPRERLVTVLGIYLVYTMEHDE